MRRSESERATIWLNTSLDVPIEIAPWRTARSARDDSAGPFEKVRRLTWSPPLPADRGENRVAGVGLQRQRE